MSYAIRSYEGQDEWVSKKWLAHMNLGNDVYMSFFGATQKEAEEKARAWYEKEQAHFRKIYVPDGPVKVKTNDDDENISLNDSLVYPERVDDSKYTSWGSSWSKPADGRSLLAGKIWMVKIAADGSKDKKRVDPSEQSKYEADGYFRGGPRS